MSDHEFVKWIETIASDSEIDRNCAWKAIVPLIERAARIARMKSPDEALGIIFEKVQAKLFSIDATEGILSRFISWCTIILKRHEIDAHRKRSRKKEISFMLDKHEQESSHSKSFLRNAELLPEDLRLLSEWSVQDRVRMLLMAGLWHLLPRLQWEHDLLEAGIDPALIAKLEHCDERKERVKVIAQELGVPTNTLYQTWKRKSPLFKMLSLAKQRLDT